MLITNISEDSSLLTRLDNLIAESEEIRVSKQRRATLSPRSPGPDHLFQAVSKSPQSGMAAVAFVKGCRCGGGTPY